MRHATTRLLAAFQAICIVSGVLIPSSLDVCIGEGVRIRLIDFPRPLTVCNVTSPSGVVSQLFPAEDPSGGVSRVRYWDSEVDGERCGFRVDGVTAEDYGTWKLSAYSEGDFNTSSEAYVKPRDCGINSDREFAFLPGKVGWIPNCGEDGSKSCFLDAPGGGGSQRRKPPSAVANSCVSQVHAPFNSPALGQWHCEWSSGASMREFSSKTTLSYKDTIAEMSVGISWRNSSGEVVMWCDVKKFAFFAKLCRWVPPGGGALYPSNGLALGRYSQLERPRGGSTGDCGISIKLPLASEDVGVWRCEVYEKDETNGKLSMGAFLELGIPKRTRDQKAESLRTWVGEDLPGGLGHAVAVAGAPLIIGCSVNSSLSFCRIIRPNGSAVVPGADEKPFGRGLRLGDCGIQVLKADRLAHSGTWRCLVGVDYGEAIEAKIRVLVHETYLDGRVDSSGYSPTLTCETVMGEDMEHCRFERPNGSVFVVADMKDMDIQREGRWEMGFRATSNLTRGVCSITLMSVNAEDVGEWRCVGRIVGRPEEYIAILKVRPLGIVGASVGTIFAVVVIILVLFAIGVAVSTKMYKRRRNRSLLAGISSAQPQTQQQQAQGDAAAAGVTFRRSSDESSEES